MKDIDVAVNLYDLKVYQQKFVVYENQAIVQVITTEGPIQRQIFDYQISDCVVVVVVAV